MNALAWFGIAVASLVAGSLLSTIFQSLRDLARARLENLAGDAGLARVRAILDDVDGHANALSLPRTLANLTVVIATTMWIVVSRGHETPSVGDLVAGIGVSCLAVWFFGSVIPIAVGRHAAEGTVLLFAPLIRLNYLVFRPAHFVASMIDEAVRRLSGRTQESEAEQLEQELISVVEEVREDQTDPAEREMISAVVRFRDTTVVQIMTPRTEVEAMEFTNNLSEVTATIRRVGHSRIPVYEGDLDHISGIFYVKDLMRWLAGEGSRGGRTFDLKALLRPPLFVPETKTIRDLLKELLAKKVHIAVVADEFGGTAGLVTVEDIMEELVGDIADEYEIKDELPEYVVKPAEGVAELDARVYVADANANLEPLGVEIPSSADYDTVGGYVIVSMGRIPSVGETFEAEGFVATVLAAEPTRVTRLKLVVRKPAAEGDQTAEPKVELPEPAAGL